MHQRVTELSPFVDGARGFRRDVAGDASGEGELFEEPLQAVGVLGNVGIDLAVCSFEVCIRDESGAAVAGAGDVYHVEAIAFDDAVEMSVDEIESGRGSPMAQEAGLHVVQCEGLFEQRVIQQIDLTHRKVVRSTPVGVQFSEFFSG